MAQKKFDYFYVDKTHHQVDLLCIPGPQSNKKVDECTVRESLNETMTSKLLWLLRLTNFDNRTFKETTTRWSAIVTCGIVRILWPYKLWRRTKSMLYFSNVIFKIIPSCLGQVKKESLHNFLYDSFALKGISLQFLGIYRVRNLECLIDVLLING